MTEEIITKRLLLREVSHEDSHSLFDIWSNPKVTEFMNISPMTKKEQAIEMIHFFQKLSKSNKGNRYSIIHRETNQIIGSCGFNYLDFDNDRGEIGYELSDNYWGNGYMGESLYALIQHGFNHFRLNRIEAKVEPTNVASKRLLQKLGFIEEGLLRKYEKAKGEYIDLFMFSVLIEDLT